MVLQDTNHGRKPKVYKSLLQLIADHGLVDVWPRLMQFDLGYTHYSCPYQKLARLDYFFATSMLIYDAQIQLYPRVTSDHNPLVLKLKVQGMLRPRGNFSFDLTLFNDQFKVHIRQWLAQFLDINRNSTKLGIVWDALKEGLRGEILSFGLHDQKQQRILMQGLYDNLQKAEYALVHALRSNYDCTLAQTEVARCKNMINAVWAKDNARKYQAFRRDCYEYGEAIGKCLAKKIRIKEAKGAITAVVDKEGKLVESSGGILEVFREFYEGLYTEDCHDKSKAFFIDPHRKKLSPEDCRYLEEPVTLVELIEAVGWLAAGKAAGPDKIPIEIFKTFLPELQTDLLMVLKEAQKGDAPASWEEASINIF